ncbi:hypothetical protein J7F01_16835 [Streptomyces sp. ISL-22]|uniref:hypothetical protein n=1 Tax=unclassified Streptomyces TaxID=2593676 RepID=UPI001BE63444|nr:MULTISPECIES: hypothetical protein [unclassified Streptomyces]MBT2423411.1 hypothetical protein [Streptomyces sp. ISL-24]MBT2433816.1 hypothetical protein [Streptomyces sp. ISL-22]
MPSTIVALVILAIAVAVIFSTLVAVGAGYLARRDGATMASTMTRACVAFGATLTLFAVITTAVTGLFT